MLKLSYLPHDVVCISVLLRFCVYFISVTFLQSVKVKLFTPHYFIMMKNTSFADLSNISGHLQEASNVVDIKTWPVTLDTDDMPKKKLPVMYRAPTAEMLAYLDFR